MANRGHVDEGLHVVMKDDPPPPPAPVPPDVKPKRSRYGRAASYGKDRNREAKNRFLNKTRRR